MADFGFAEAERNANKKLKQRIAELETERDYYREQYQDANAECKRLRTYVSELELHVPLLVKGQIKARLDAARKGET